MTITNDGATILKQMQVLHPAARMVRDVVSGIVFIANYVFIIFIRVSFARLGLSNSETPLSKLSKIV